MTREFVGMPRKKGLWLVLGGILALVLALWLLREPVRTARRPPVEESVEPSASSTFVAPDARPSVRLAAPMEALASPPPELPADPRLDWLRGTVVDAAGTPVRGANVVVLRVASSDNTLLFQLDPSFRSGLERAAEAETDVDGRFGFSLARGIPFDLEASAAGRSDGFAPLCYAGEDVLVTLSAEHAVGGRLTRERDGAPIEGALVRVIGYPSYATRESHSTSDGRYRVSFPFDGWTYLEVLPREEEAIQWTSIELGPDGTAQMDFVLPNGVAVVGRVIEAGSGRPLAGAIVGEGWQFRRSAVTDAEGRYRLAGIGGPGAYGLAAKAKGHGMVKRMELPGAVGGALDVDFELPLAWTASGRVVDRTGAPVENALVLASGSRHDKDGQQLERSTSRTDGEGRFRLAELTPGSRQWLTVSAPGFAHLGRPLPEPAAGGESAVGELILAPPALVAGRVLDADGEGLEDAEVHIQGAAGWRSAYTDALGRFAFGDLAPGQYAVAAKWNERAAEPRIELVLADQEIREGLELHLPRGRSLSGRVVDERGKGISGVNVAATLRRALDAAGEPENPHPLHFFSASDEDGAFRFDDVPAGDYLLRAFPRQGVATDPDAPWLDGSLQSVATDSAPVEIVLVKGEVIRGRVFDAAGEPLVNFSVVGRGPGGHRTLISGTDALGRFKLAVAPGTTWDLEVNRPLQGASNEKPLLVERDVVAGARDLILQLSSR